MKEYETFSRVGIEKERSYYIPFDLNDEIKKRFNRLLWNSNDGRISSSDNGFK